MRQKLLALLPLLLILSACAMNPATGRPHFTLISEDAEFEIGHKTVQEAIKADGLYTELPELVNAYRDIGAKLVAVSERADKPFDFIIIDSPTFNAWATPGYVNFYRGILPYLNSESEFIAIMGHEVGHITARHTVRQISSSIFTQILVTGAAIAIAANTDSDALAQSAIIAGGVLAGIGLSAYGRGAEFESDDLGGRYLERLDHNPAEAANAIRALLLSKKFQNSLHRELFGKDMPQSPVYHIFASHPDSGDRIARLEEKYGKPELRSFERAPRLHNDTVGREKYLRLIDGLSYGPKKEAGVVTRSRMYMPKDRFMLSLPEGYMASNGLFSESWLIADGKNQRALEISTTQLKRSASAEEAMRIIAPRGRNIRLVTLSDGVTAAVAEVPIPEGSDMKAKGMLIYVIPGANSDDKDEEGNATRRFHLFTMMSLERTLTDEDRKVFADIVMTYKPLTSAEAERIEPLRIGLYTVRPGDSVASISRNMPFGALREELFRTLNGMDENDEVKPGMLMKVVMDKNTVR